MFSININEIFINKKKKNFITTSLKNYNLTNFHKKLKSR